MEPKPKITLSVLMPVYNERYLVGECIKRVLDTKNNNIFQIELIIVDDGSTDGTREILRKTCVLHPEIRYIEHEKNTGKGGAIRTAIGYAKGDICIIQDADLEYSPQDYFKIIKPFIDNDADAVFGSRFLVGEYTAVLNFYHKLANKFLTFLVNAITNMTFTDIETCYKAVRTNLLKTIPLRSNDFRMEPELAIKLAKRGARIFEAPISYSGRTKEEGKKIKWTDGVLALGAILKYLFTTDEYYKEDKGTYTLYLLHYARNFYKWTADLIRQHVGQHVLEIGAGNGNLTLHILPRDHYVISDVNTEFLEDHMHKKKIRPFIDVRKIDILNENDFAGLEASFDTVIVSNVIEHVEDDVQAVLNVRKVLKHGGAAIILVPCDPNLFSNLDINVGHKRRYTEASLNTLFEKAGFSVEKIFYYNRLGKIGWFINGRIFKRHFLSPVQIRLYDLMIPLVKHVDNLLPWQGLTLIGVGRLDKNQA